MEDSSKYHKNPGVKGMTEIFRIYYDKNCISFDEFLYLEYLVILTATLAKWKIFKALPTTELGPLMICKN